MAPSSEVSADGEHLAPSHGVAAGCGAAVAFA